MNTKRILNPNRQRQVPAHFSWLDHRLVREQRLARARRDLISLDLVAYDPPLYQVLSLPEAIPVAARFARLHALLERRA